MCCFVTVLPSNARLLFSVFVAQISTRSRFVLPFMARLFFFSASSVFFFLLFFSSLPHRANRLLASQLTSHAILFHSSIHSAILLILQLRCSCKKLGNSLIFLFFSFLENHRKSV